jgi:ABC-type Mn2+/Zn2+ transport system permease subunit/Mn-dependent DtxR family transcriptional regulator
MEFFDMLSSVWAIRAILASSMVGIMCGLIGCFIVLRNMSLIGDALSHAILPGIFVSFILVGYSTIGFFTGSVIAGLLTAVAITWIQQNISTKNDAAIGIVFTAMFSVGVIGISWISQEKGAHLDLKDFLFGNVLGISSEDLIITAVVLVYTLASVVLFFRYLFITTFQSTIAQTMGISVKTIHYFLMLLLSFAVVSALRSVGVILVVAMLITPASTALLLSNRLQKVLVISAIIGLISAVMGMVLAIIFNTTPGPVMVLFVTAIYLLVAILAPEKGFIPKYLARLSQSNRITREDIIKFINKNENESTFTKLFEFLDIKASKLRSHLKFLEKSNAIMLDNNVVKLTYAGKSEANKLVRAHRLWETYQVDKMGLSEQQIHNEAERYEHLLSDEILDEVDEKLGFPEKDPHGSPIPKKQLQAVNGLYFQHPKKEYKISPHQLNHDIEGELWELGLMPESSIFIEQTTKNHIKISSGNKKLKIPKDLAISIEVL